MKEVVHELGHGFGLVHCPDYACVMASSAYVEGVDLKQDVYCRDCRLHMEGDAFDRSAVL